MDNRLNRAQKRAVGHEAVKSETLYYENMVVDGYMKDIDVFSK
jgi:hypothetical protein